jgi:hypothetical protein
MAVSTANAVLRRGIVDWRDSFTGVTARQQASDVKSSLLDICIDAGVNTSGLPTAVQALFVEADNRAQRQARGGFPQPFDTAELIRVATSALKEL